MGYSFFCYGNPNILGTHKNTFEFTKDDFLTKNGDCIIGIKAEFELCAIKELIKGKDKLNVKIECNGISEEIGCNVNHKFNSDHEVVFRLGEFASERTLGIRTSKSAKEINRELIKRMTENDSRIKVTLS